MPEPDSKLFDLDTKMWQMQGQVERLREKLDRTIGAYVQEKSNLRDEVAEQSEYVTACFTTIHTMQVAMFQVKRWHDEEMAELDSIKKYITSKFGYKFKTQDDEEIPF